MNDYQAIIFDLDDTLLDRDKAVEKLFSIILEQCYGNVEPSSRGEMLEKFKVYDNRGYGKNDKAEVLESFFEKFPPKHRLPNNSIQDFWNNNFPHCFSMDEDMINIINSIKTKVKVAIITNGSTQRQKAKIINAGLNSCFEVIIISEEVGLRKPDKRIFELALKRLNVQPESAFFVGDNIELDIGGCQNANIKGIWFNPHKAKNESGIKPFAEIDSIGRLLKYINQ